MFLFFFKKKKALPTIESFHFHFCVSEMADLEAAGVLWEK